MSNEHTDALQGVRRPRMTVVRGQQYGRWRIERKVGSGGNGEVWIARDVDGGRVAIKLLTKTKAIAYTRFKDEVAVMQSCAVQGVVPVLDSHLPDTLEGARPWYAMPVGVPLPTALVNATIHAIVRAVAEIAETMAELHSREIVHRDIKPANTLQLGNRAMIGDFGLVQYPGKEDLTGAREALGPRWTMAPEVRRHNKGDARPSDVYSLAKTLWIFITKETEGFEGRYVPESSESIEGYAGGVYVAPLEHALARATDPDPQSRLPMSDFARELREWLRLEDAWADRNRLQWVDLQSTLFPSALPARAEWTDADAIVRVLGMVSRHSNLNHVLFPRSGGMDLSGARRSTREPGCIELDLQGMAGLVRPRRLLFESFGTDPQWHYFRLETDSLPPSGLYRAPPSSGYEEVVDIPGETYRTREAWDEGWHQGERLPRGSRLVLRFLGGAFLVVQKSSIYNGIPQTYDGIHNRMGADEFRTGMQRLAQVAAQARQDGQWKPRERRHR